MAFAATLLLVPGCREDSKHPGALQGIIELDERSLGFETGGRVASISVDEGDEVIAGQVLAQLDDDLSRAVVAARGHEAAAAAAQTALLRAGSRPEEVRAMRAQLDAASAQEVFLAKTLARHRALEGAVGASPAAVVDEVESKHVAAVAQRKAVEQQLAALRDGARFEEISTAEARAAAATAATTLETRRLARHELTAPMRGVVLDVPIEPGEIVAPGAPVLVIADTARPFADVFVPQGDLDGISVGEPAVLHVDATDQPFAAVVEYISRRAEFTPRFLFSERERPNLVIRVRVRIEDPSQRLHAGVPAFVYLRPAAVGGR